MPPTKMAPPRSCAWCGLTLERKRYNGRLEDFAVFQRRKFCGVPCMSQNFDSAPTQATSVTAKTGNYHARKIVPPGPCANCGKPEARDVHHVNWDRNDNRPENLIRLCRGCHLRGHRYADSLPPNVSAL